MFDEKAYEKFKEQILRDGPRLGPTDRFRFQCHSGLECFNHCCHDVNIFLTPYDVIRIKSRLRISSEDFLDRYCVIPFSKAMKYPIIMLKMKDDEELSCPFLDAPKGCSIYEDRPWSCRMYPLGRAAPPESERDEPFHFLLREDFCEGHQQAAEWTVSQWLDDQCVGEYDAAGKGFQQIVQDKRLTEDSDFSPAQMDMIFMVFYDIDRFRRFVFDTKFLNMFQICQEAMDSIRESDTALMRFGFDWLRFALWKDPTLTIREEIVRARLAHTGIKR
ncbi:YkgJ family cysteine cluster protein [Candidatus Sumerlaeota bacterium]|nr:YkgJ family cysteine cluster protein [Candidatus Sumerlaeota bacterium]